MVPSRAEGSSGEIGTIVKYREEEVCDDEIWELVTKSDVGVVLRLEIQTEVKYRPRRHMTTRLGALATNPNVGVHLRVEVRAIVTYRGCRINFGVTKIRPPGILCQKNSSPQG